MLNIYQEQNHDGQGETAEELEKIAKTKPVDYKQYSDPTGEVSGKFLTRALWFSKHKVVLRRIFLSALVLFIIFSYGFSLYGFGEYLIVGLSQDAKLDASAVTFINYLPLQAHYAPQQFGIVGTNILPGGVNKYDVVSVLSNPNEHWLVNFDYHFEVDGQPMPKQSDFLLAGETKPVAYFGISGAAAPSSANIVIDKVNWTRISTKKIIDPVAWQADRLNFEISKFSFIYANSAATTSASADIILFNFKNASSYGYKAPFCIVGLYNNSSLVGVMPLRLADFQSLSDQNLDLRSFVPNLQVDDVKVFPQINVYDPGVYLAPPSQ